MKIRYKGSQSEGVTILAVDLHAPWGEPVDVPDELGKSLLEQEDNWERVAAKPKAPKAPKAGKKAAPAGRRVGGPVPVDQPALVDGGEAVVPADNNDQADAGQED